MSSYSRESCPWCRRQVTLDAVDIDGDFQLYACNSCNEIVAFDDALDEQTLIELLELNRSSPDDSDDDIRVDVQIKLVKCDNCGNEDNDQFEIVDIRPDEDAGDAVAHLVNRCLGCGHQQTTLLVDCGDDDTSVHVDEHNVSDSSADAVAGVTELNVSFVCECGNEEMDCFQLDHTASEQSDVVATCLACDRVVRAPVTRHVGFDECWSCGRTRAAGLMSELYDQNGDLIHLRCLVCDIDLQLPGRPFRQRSSPAPSSPSNTGYSCYDRRVDQCYDGVCRHCGNRNRQLIHEQYDADGTLILLQCLVCKTELELPGQLQRTVAAEQRNCRPRSSADCSCSYSASSGNNCAGYRSAPRRERIRNMYELRRGDHIALHQAYVVWHHAIVESVLAENCYRGRLNVIHNSGDASEVLKKIRSPSVRQETVPVDLNKQELYRYDYSEVVDGMRYSADEIVRRAKSRLCETYNPFTFNCEHFARWCVTGNQKSDQVRTFAERLGVTGGCTVAKAAQEAIATGVEYAANGAAKIFPKCLRYVEQRSVAMFKGVTNAARNLKVGAIVGNVVVNLVAEGIMFGVDAFKSYRKYRSGEISKDDFRQQLSKAGVETAGGFIGSTVFGILGQILVPIPFIGGLIGCTLGGLLGRFAGAMIGKLIGKK